MGTVHPPDAYSSESDIISVQNRCKNRNISKHQRQQSRRPAQFVMIFGSPTTIFLEQMWTFKKHFFNTATYFAVAHMLVEESFFISKKHAYVNTRDSNVGGQLNMLCFLDNSQL